MIVKRESAGIRRYVHLSTGNYNDKTAELYTDIGLMSADETLTYETALFFNIITGYSTVPVLDKLTLAPLSLKRRILELITREIDKSASETPGHIMAKVNSLTDIEIIEALYRASRAGVRIQLLVRGECLLVPGKKGQSEGIEVISIIDRFLEHSRVLYFANGGDPEVFLSSADWMPRNLERRIELLFPVEQENLRRRVAEVLRLQFQDNTKAHKLDEEGRYHRIKPKRGEKVIRSQEEIYRQTEARINIISPQREFNVRRKPPK